jgi:hypothetical protein
VGKSWKDALKPLVSPSQYEDGHYELSVEQAKQIKIHRAADGGYQRKPSLKRVAEIAEELKLLKDKGRKSNFPAIRVANISGKLECVDGQHRLLGHIQAGMPIMAHVFSCTQKEANDLFIRDNGTVRALRREELVAGSQHALAKSIRSMAKAFGVHEVQVTICVIGLLGSLDLHKDRELDERQSRALTIVLDSWSKDARFKPWQLRDMSNTEARKKFEKSVERSFSASNTFWLLGRLCKENIHNLNKLKSDLRIIQESDWQKMNLNSLRYIVKESTTKKTQRKLWEYVEREVLLPAYKELAK